VGAVKVEITIGDMLTGLATPEESRQRAIERHGTAITFIEMLLLAKEGESFTMPALLP
jgi:hypothetical protein